MDEAMKMRSGGAAQLDDGQMSPALDVTHRESELVSVGTVATRSVWPMGARLQPSPSCRSVRPDFTRRLPGERRMRSVCVVPDRVQTDFAANRRERRRNEKPPRALLLHRSDESLNDGNARRLTDPSVARSDVSTLAPTLEAAAPELCSLVGDDVSGCGPARPDGTVKESLHLIRRWRLREDRETNEYSRDLIDRDGDPTTERPTLRQREREPRHPKSSPGWHGREINMPSMTRIPSHYTTTAAGSHLGIVFRRRTGFPDHAPNRGCTQDKPGPAEYLCHAFVSHCGEETLQLTDKIPDEVRIPVDGFDGLNERPFARFIEASHPEE